MELPQSTLWGGAGGFTYLWVDGQTTQMADTLTVGNFTVTVTDALGCTAETSVAISSPNPILIGQNTLPTNCFDSPDGFVEILPAGGTPGYTYAWSDGGSATAIRNDLAGGMYQVTVTDANNCFEVVDVEILSPTEIVLQLTLDNNVSCGGGADGMATVSGSGGAGGIDFLWSSGSFPTNPTATGLSAGWVTVTATDANGCIKVDSIELTEPTPISLVTDSTDVTCNGFDTGTATVLPTGGAGGFTYQWDANANNQVTSTASTLTAGTYDVTVTDANMCEEIISVTVLEPPVLTIDVTAVDAICFGEANGESVVVPTGGTPNFAYEWSDGNLSDERDDMVAGTYTVTVTDTNGCTISETITIGSPTELTVDLTSIDIECFGQNTGSTTATAGGGAGNYSYLWSDNQTTPMASTLVANTYTVTVTDDNMCTVTESITINQPAEFSISNNVITNVDCNSASTGGVDITITGGIAPLTYSWTGGSTMEDLSLVAAGTYTVLVTDANMCTVQQTYTIGEPDALALSFTPSNVGCFMGNDGMIDVEATGGVGNYSYLWTFPDGSTDDPEDLQMISAGTYTVLVTDGNGCTITDMVNITQPATGVSLSMSPDDLICFQGTDGSLTVTATGGTSPYQYLWSDNIGQTTPTANNLSTGIYTVTVTDASDCTFTASALVNEQPEITVSLSQNGASCHNTSDGTATIENILLGGTPANISDYTISWNTVPAQTSSSASNLDGGETYSVIITDMLGCTASASIGIDQPAEVFAEIISTSNVVCKDGNDGTATASGSGGTAPYTYAWGGSAGNQSTETASNLLAGNYTVTVSDANGCTATATAVIDEPTAMEIRSFDVVDVACTFGSTGSLTVSVDGGTAPYNYTWSNGFGIPTISDLSAGTYSVTVSDINGCTVIGQETIREPAEALEGQIDFSNVTCFDGSDGQIFIVANGGTGPYTYTLDGINFNGSPTQLGLVSGVYPNVAIVDANGCEYLFQPLTISEPPPVTVDLGPDTTIFFGEGLWISPTSNVTGVTFDWSPANNESINCTTCETVFIDSLNSQTSFELVITDENGCEGSDIITVFVRKLRELMVPTGFSPNGDGNNDLLLVHGRKGSTILSMQVFDRWGELVYDGRDFQINDDTVGWDGTFKGQDMNTGVYIWQIEVEYEDGAREVHKGSTTLIR